MPRLGAGEAAQGDQPPGPSGQRASRGGGSGLVAEVLALALGPQRGAGLFADWTPGRLHGFTRSCVYFSSVPFLQHCASRPCCLEHVCAHACTMGVTVHVCDRACVHACASVCALTPETPAPSSQGVAPRSRHARGRGLPFSPGPSVREDPSAGTGPPARAPPPCQVDCQLPGGQLPQLPPAKPGSCPSVCRPRSFPSPPASPGAQGPCQPGAPGGPGRSPQAPAPGRRGHLPQHPLRSCFGAAGHRPRLPKAWSGWGRSQPLPTATGPLRPGRGMCPHPGRGGGVPGLAPPQKGAWGRDWS